MNRSGKESSEEKTTTGRGGKTSTDRRNAKQKFVLQLRDSAEHKTELTVFTTAVSTQQLPMRRNDL